MGERWSYDLCLVGGQTEPDDRSSKPPAVEYVGVERVGCDVLALPTRAHGAPIPRADGRKVAAAGGASGAGVLLSPTNPVGESVYCDHVVELRRGLVVPGAPSLRAVEADDRPLVRAQ